MWYLKDKACDPCCTYFQEKSMKTNNVLFSQYFLTFLPCPWHKGGSRVLLHLKKTKTLKRKNLAASANGGKHRVPIGTNFSRGLITCGALASSEGATAEVCHAKLYEALAAEELRHLYCQYENKNRLLAASCFRDVFFG